MLLGAAGGGASAAVAHWQPMAGVFPVSELLLEVGILWLEDAFGVFWMN